MPRFFVDQPLEGQVFLGGEDGRHLAKSLRVRPGEEVTLCDGRGDVGYTKPSNFSAAFKKKYGVMPKDYREASRIK